MCEFTNKCWRYSYSKYYLSIEKYQVPPDRQTIFLANCASLEQMPKKGIYCENMPCQGSEKNLCPFLLQLDCSSCHERVRELARIKRNANKTKTIKFQNKEERLPIPREIRLLIAARNNYRCVYCGKYQNALDERGDKVQIVVDHFVPLAVGGHPTDLENLVTACRKCNRDKGTEIWEKGCRL